MSSITAQATTGTAKARSRQVGKRSSALNLRTLKGQFTLHASLVLLLAAILTLLGSTTFSHTSSDLATIDSGSIPSVNAAQTITEWIGTIDAQSADYLATAGLTSIKTCSITTNLNGTTITATLTTHACDERNIDAETVLVNETLFQAAHNVTYVGEQTAVERITIGLESYLEDIHQMRVDYDLAVNKTDPNDPYLKQAYQAYLNASDILHGQISLATIGASQIPLDKEANLPNCTLPTNQMLTPRQWTQGSLTNALDCLSYINYSHLQGAYADAGNFLGGSTTGIIILSILLGLFLLAGTGWMILTSHRFLNLGLLTATLLSLVFCGTSINLLSSLQGQNNQDASQDGAFRQLVQDDYNSVYYAALLNRYGTDANADESRWLIALEFHDQANITHWQNDWNQNVQEIQFLMHKAHDNQTWPEEVQPLSNMDNNWNQYYTVDGQIRSAAQNQSDPQRLLTAEGISTGTSNEAFSQFANAVTALSNANQGHYKQTFNSINGTLMFYFWLSLTLFPLVGLLALWGISTRLKDF